MAGAMTVPKGNRGKGWLIGGATMHQTGRFNSHEIMVMPTMTMRPCEEDVAIYCAVPTNGLADYDLASG